MLEYAIVKTAAPLLNRPDFTQIFGGKEGNVLPLDGQGLLRATETIALGGTKLQILEQLGNHIARIKTADYTDAPLYVDLRFVEAAKKSTLERKKILPSTSQVLTHLISLKGLPYVWGGNWGSGIPEMLEFYPPKLPLDPFTSVHWTFKGVDCSGLLYQATDGFIPRNTSELMHFGKMVWIEDLSVEQIAARLRPLDLIVWKGHVVIVFDSHCTIESRAGHGVVVRDLKERLSEIMAAHAFVIRRWHPEYI